MGKVKLDRSIGETYEKREIFSILSNAAMTRQRVSWHLNAVAAVIFMGSIALGLVAQIMLIPEPGHDLVVSREAMRALTQACQGAWLAFICTGVFGLIVPILNFLHSFRSKS